MKFKDYITEKKTDRAVDFIIGQLQNDENSTDAEMILHLAKETHNPIGKVSKMVKAERTNFLSNPLMNMVIARKLVRKYL